MNPTVVTRFAPSPTGALHVGGARTALFNWAFARRHGGQFILRMEDTDRARSTAASARTIINDLRWLGIDWDQGPDASAADPYAYQIGDRGPYFQSQRDGLYRDYLDRLFAAGRAYKCFKTTQELAADRQRAMQEKRATMYDATEARSRSAAETAQLEAQGLPYVVRFRMGDEDVTVHDLVLGEVTIRATELEDFIIVKGDGGPTFHFANVVDDATMGVTHVIRAQEHLMNTPKHVAMFDALGIERPKYAHLPLIFNPDGTKMSKRDKAKIARAAARQQKLEFSALAAASMHDAAAFETFMNKKSDDLAMAQAIAGVLNISLPEIDVDDFRDSGYLPEVLCNYIALLGWNPGSDVEKFDNAFLIDNFSFDRVGKSNAKFDREKLLAFNADAIAKLPPSEFAARWTEHLGKHHREFLAKFPTPALAKLAQLYQPRVRTLGDPAVAGRFFVLADDELAYDEKAVKKVLHKDGGAGLTVLRELTARLEACEPWDAAAIHAAIETHANETGRNMGEVAQPLRVAVSGGSVSPPIHDTLAILGKRATLARIDHCLRAAAL